MSILKKLKKKKKKKKLNTKLNKIKIVNKKKYKTIH